MAGPPGFVNYDLQKAGFFITWLITVYGFRLRNTSAKPKVAAVAAR